MSNIVLLIVVVLACSSTESAAQVNCVNPIEISELRVMNSALCLNMPGTDGRGDAATWGCDGYSDQEMIMCGDGTLRNTASPSYCITPDVDGGGNLRSNPCNVYPAIPDYQKWTFNTLPRTFVDNGGIEQLARRIVNVESGECMDVSGTDGSGNIMAWPCHGMDDQYFYFRSRGALLGHGRLQVERSGYCLDVSGSQGRGNLFLNNCENGDDQYFSFYENGELVNTKSGLCVNVEGYDGTGDVDLNMCEDALDQMWTLPSQYCNGEYCSFVNKKSAHCLNVLGYDATQGSDVNTHNCEGEPDQRFRWVTESWVTPSATWSLIGCNQNGEVANEISNTVSYTETLSSSTTLEISSTIEAGTSFGSASVTATMSTTLSKEWQESQSGTIAIAFTCQFYDTGAPFTGGCMWQLQLTTRKTTSNALLTWSPQIVKCTAGNSAPICPPFTTCRDDSCTMCEEMPGLRKKRSVDESLTWKKVLKID